MRKARPLYAGEDLGLDINNTVYALDSTTVDLSLTLFPWADFRKNKAGIKMHTQVDLRGPIPTCIFVSTPRQHDVLWLDDLLFEAGSFYVQRPDRQTQAARGVSGFPFALAQDSLLRSEGRAGLRLKLNIFE